MARGRLRGTRTKETRSGRRWVKGEFISAIVVGQRAGRYFYPKDAGEFIDYGGNVQVSTIRVGLYTHINNRINSEKPRDKIFV